MVICRILQNWFQLLLYDHPQAARKGSKNGQYSRQIIRHEQ